MQEAGEEELGGSADSEGRVRCVLERARCGLGREEERDGFGWSTLAELAS